MPNTPKKVIISAGGLSSLFLPISKVFPREMVPIGNKPLIHHVLDEAIELNGQKIGKGNNNTIDIEEICIVYNKNQKIVFDYFHKNEEYKIRKKILEEREQCNKLEEIEKLYDKLKDNKIELKFSKQENFHGLADAIYHTKCPEDGEDSFINENDESFFLMLGDILTKNCEISKNLFSAYRHYGSNIIAAKNISPNEVNVFGVIDGPKIGNDIYKIRKIMEKPTIDESLSNLGIMGRYIFNYEIFEYIEKLHKQHKESLSVSKTNEEKLYSKFIKGMLIDKKEIKDKYSFNGDEIEYIKKLCKEHEESLSVCVKNSQNEQDNGSENKINEKIVFSDVMNEMIADKKEIYAQRIHNKSIKIWNEFSFLMANIEVLIETEDENLELSKETIINYLKQKNMEHETV